MKRRLFIGFAILVGVVVTAMLVAASIWPVINDVRTGQTPEYPHIQPHYYTAKPRRIYDQAKGAVEKMARWKLKEADPAQMNLHATHRTAVFGFVDDVWVSIEPVTEFVTRVNVHSKSRIGKGDFGQNARNIRQFLAELDRRLGAVKFDPNKLRAGAGDKKGAPSKSDAGQTHR